MDYSVCALKFIFQTSKSFVTNFLLKLSQFSLYLNIALLKDNMEVIYFILFIL